MWRAAELTSKFEAAVCNLCCCYVLILLMRLQVYLHPHCGIGINDDQAQRFIFKPYTIMDASDDLPLKWFECQSIGSRRIAIMVLQVNTGDSVNVIWYGDTFAYRGALSKSNVTGHFLNKE